MSRSLGWQLKPDRFHVAVVVVPATSVLRKKLVIGNEPLANSPPDLSGPDPVVQLTSGRRR